MKKETQNRANNISTLHMLGALFVMYGHHSAILGQPIISLFGCLIQAIGVKLIFFISGYFITKSLWTSNGTRFKISLSYLIKRTGRLFPEYIVCVCLAALVVAPLVTMMTPIEYINVWGDAVKQYIFFNIKLYPVFWLPEAFQDNIYSGVMNGSLWTMPVEVALYFVVLAIFLCSKREDVRKLVYTIVTIGIVLLLLTRIKFFPLASVVWNGTDWVQALNVLPYFLIGGIAYLYKWEKYVNLQVGTLLILLFASGTVLNNQLFSEIVCMSVLPYIVMSLMSKTKQKITLPFVQGECAYGMYLYGFIVQQCIMQWGFDERIVNFLSFHISFIICVIITYFIAFMSNRIVYKPISVLIKKLLVKMG